MKRLLTMTLSALAIATAIGSANATPLAAAGVLAATPIERMLPDQGITEARYYHHYYGRHYGRPRYHRHYRCWWNGHRRVCAWR